MKYSFSQEEIKKLKSVYSEDVALSSEYILKYNRKELTQSELMKEVLKNCKEVEEGRYLLSPQISPEDLYSGLKASPHSSLGNFSDWDFDDKEFKMQIIKHVVDEKPLSKLAKKQKFLFSNFKEENSSLLREIRGYAKNVENILGAVKGEDFYLSYRPFDIITMSHSWFESCYSVKGCNVHSPWVLSQSPKIGIVYSVFKGADPTTHRKKTRFFFFDTGEGFLHLGRQYGSGSSRAVFHALLGENGLYLNNFFSISGLSPISTSAWSEWFYSPELSYYADARNRTSEEGVLLKKEWSTATSTYETLKSMTFLAKEIQSNEERECFENYSYICPICNNRYFFASDFGDSDNYKSLACCADRGWCSSCGNFETECWCDEEDCYE